MKRLQGTPWQIGYISMSDADKRRHRSRCYYYDRKTKRCLWRCGRCAGASHCPAYKEEK